MSKMIEMEGGLQFYQLAKVEHEGIKYLFVVNMQDNLRFLFLKQGDAQDEVIPIEDGKLIVELTQEVRKQLIQTIKENSSKGKSEKKKTNK